MSSSQKESCFRSGKRWRYPHRQKKIWKPSESWIILNAIHKKKDQVRKNSSLMTKIRWSGDMTLKNHLKTKKYLLDDASFEARETVSCHQPPVRFINIRMLTQPASSKSWLECEGQDRLQWHWSSSFLYNSVFNKSWIWQWFACCYL